MLPQPLRKSKCKPTSEQRTEINDRSRERNDRDTKRTNGATSWFFGNTSAVGNPLAMLMKEETTLSDVKNKAITTGCTYTHRVLGIFERLYCKDLEI